MQKEYYESLSDNDLIALGYRGKEIGNALESLLDAVLENRIENQKEALLLYLQKQKLLQQAQREQDAGCCHRPGMGLRLQV